MPMESKGNHRVLICSPDRYGRFGHQTTSILASLLIAELTGSKVLLPRYMYFCHKWNTYVKWRDSSYVIDITDELSREVIYLESSNIDANGNTKWELNNSKEVQQFLNTFQKTPDKSILYLPFDQHPGILRRLLLQDSVGTSIRRCFENLTCLPTPYKEYICLHIRRGDCRPDNHPQWYIDNMTYIAIISSIADAIPDIPIVICTQGSTEWLTDLVLDINISARLHISSTNQYFINDEEINAFALMANARYLITCGSSFGHIAAYAGAVPTVLDISRDGIHNWHFHTLSPDLPKQLLDKKIVEFINHN